MARIEDLLHRRTDLSTFLVHLTRANSEASALENLLSIADENTIRAGRALGPAAHLEPHLAGSSTTQKVVCFTEPPLEHTWMMMERIDGRAVQLEPYGIAITKTTARRAHFNPVWYSDISARGGRDWPMVAVNKLVSEAVERATDAQGVVIAERLREEPILKIAPYIEQMGPTTNGQQKEFWWEREWRRIDDYTISVPSQI